MKCSLPVSSVHGILQIRMLESVVIPFSRGSSRHTDWAHLLLLLLLLLLSCFSRVRPCETPERAAYQAPRPWDSPGKNTGVGCHFLLQCLTVKVKSLSRVWLSGNPWTAAYQAPRSMGFSRQEYWSGVLLPSPPISCIYRQNYIKCSRKSANNENQ